MSPKNRVLLTATATVIGTLSLVLYTTLSRDVLFNNVSYCTSTSGTLLLSGMAVLLSSVVSGFLASLIVVRDNTWPHVLISFFIVGKMCFVVLCGEWSGPFWFETGQHLSLLAGLWIGSFWASKFPLAPM
ncbi:MAG: hypothetical protein AAGC43_17540 [Bacteroidota bacterium]